MFARLALQLGQIDVLFVNAGIGAFQPIEKVTEADWDSIHGINLKGVFFTVQKALPLPCEQMIRNTPMHRMGTPEEVAAAVLFLASSESASSPESISWWTAAAPAFSRLAGQGDLAMSNPSSPALPHKVPVEEVFEDPEGLVRCRRVSRTRRAYCAQAAA